MQTGTLPDVANLVGRWEIDVPHSSVEFTVRHMVISSVSGRFDRFSGAFTIAPDQTSSAAKVLISSDSISTHDLERDEHLRSGDFLDADRYPEIVFRGSWVGPRDDEGRFVLRGDLTIRGVTRLVELQCVAAGYLLRDGNGLARLALSASTSISRKDFGLTWNRALESGGVLVADEVSIRLQINAVKSGSVDQ
jgi:polyisoprenoid-binding protein YceI